MSDESESKAADGALAHDLKGPGFPATDDEVTCPSCGRFAGTYERCPYCGANMHVRLSIKALRRLSILVGFAGVALVYWSALHMEIPLRKVGDFEPTFNFAILRVRGKVVAGPYYGDRGDSFYIGVDDGSGRINIKAYGRTATALRGHEIKGGDQVEARGSVRIQSGKNPSMSLRVKTDLKVVSRAPAAPTVAPRPKLAVSQITRELAAERVKARVEGTVGRVRKTRAGIGTVLYDGEHKVDVWLFSRELSRMGEAPEHLSEGNRVEVNGRLDLYRPKRGGGEKLQLRPFPAEDGVRLLKKADIKKDAVNFRRAPRPPKPGVVPGSTGAPDSPVGTAPTPAPTPAAESVAPAPGGATPPSAPKAPAGASVPVTQIGVPAPLTKVVPVTRIEVDVPGGGGKVQISVPAVRAPGTPAATPVVVETPPTPTGETPEGAPAPTSEAAPVPTTEPPPAATPAPAGGGQ